MIGAKPEGADDGLQDHRVRFTVYPAGEVVSGEPGAKYSDCLSDAGIRLPLECGGRGACGKCRIRFRAGAPEPVSADLRLLPSTDLAAGSRLACQHEIQEDSEVELPDETHDLRSKAAVDFDLDGEVPASGVECLEVELAPPSGEKTGAEDLLDALCGSGPLALSALRHLGERPRGVRHAVRVVRGPKGVLDVRPSDDPCPVLGAAIDVGTTTLAVYLYDLARGHRIGSAAGFNPQRAFGADVISRIGKVRREGAAGLAELHRAVIDEVNGLLLDACTEAGVRSTSVYRAVVVGNPTMIHLFAGISPVGIDRSPYVPIFLHGSELPASDLGLGIHPAADVILPPGVSGYVGSDIVAGVLATSLGASGRPELLVDVGTNGELVASVDGRLVSCSTAAGPAFEGAAIVQGMSAIPGAVEDVHINGETVHATVIGGAAPRGLCGTGLIGAIDELCRCGIIDGTGRLQTNGTRWTSRLRGAGRDARFLLTEGETPVFLYQKDIREFQLGKAAIRAGIDTLLDALGIAPSQVETLYVGGAFGTHLDPRRAIRTGLLPRVDAARVRAVGNSAGHGATMILLDRERGRNAKMLAERAEYIELSTSASFSDLYVERMSFPAPAIGHHGT